MSLAIRNPQLWPWLLAALLPLALHLLTRRARQTVTLPTFRFLARAQAGRSRLARWRERLLLALRTLTALSVVLAFLKPVRTAPLGVASGKRRAVVVILDVSHSMGAARGGVSALARARAQARTLLEGLSAGDTANVILMGSTPRALRARLTTEVVALEDAAAEARPTFERGDAAAAVALAAGMLANTGAAQKQLVIASDFQRANWQDVTLDALPRGTQTAFLNAAIDPDNAALTDLRLSPAAPRPGDAAVVEATVWNGSPSPRQITARLTVKGENETPLSQEPVATVTAPAFGTAHVTFPVTFPTAARYRLTAQIPTDALPGDDTRFLTVDLRRQQNILLLTDAALTSRSASYYLRAALTPDPKQSGGIRVTIRRPAAISEAELTDCAAVILTEAAPPSDDRIRTLARWTARGGAILVFLSERQDGAFLRALGRLLKDDGGELPFAPREWITPSSGIDSSASVHFSEIKTEDALLRRFADTSAGDLNTARFTRRFQGDSGGEATTLIRFNEGTPALLRGAVGQGTLLIANFSPAPASGDLARQEAFPPLLHELLRGLIRRNEETEAECGSPLFVPLTNRAATALTAIGPDARPRTATREDATRVVISPADIPGFYSVRADGVLFGEAAANIVSIESDLRSLDHNMLKTGRGQATTIAESTSELDSLQRDRPLWQWCALAALATLLAEQTLLVWPSFRRRKGAQ